MDRLTQKYSTIVISLGNKTQVYHSIEEIPAKIREKLIETTHGNDSATLLIADQGGREEILRAIRDQPSDRFTRIAANSLRGQLAQKSKRGRFRFTWAGLGRFLVLASLAYLLWMVISLR